MKTQLTVIGGGPAGYVAAIRARQLGRDVVLIERECVGGTCLNHGCIPTKALYKNAEVLYEVQDAGKFGIQTGEIRFDLAAVRARKEQIVDKLTAGVASFLKSNGVTVLYGDAAFIDAHTLKVGSETVESDDFLIATGSKTARLPIPGLELEGILDSTSALAFTEIPEKLVLIGGGVIGVEMAGIYRAFGAEVTIVEFMPVILPMLDTESAKLCQKQLRARGIELRTGTRVQRIDGLAGAFTVTVESDKGTEAIACTHILSCAGRVPNTDGLQLENAGVSCDRKGISVDADYCTNVPHIYAVGDVTGRVMLAHVASEEGRVAVERLCGLDTHVDYALVPNCVFTFPELASVGKTEAQLKQEGIDYVASRFAFAGNGKAMTLGETDGFIKILAAADLSAVLGVHIAGPHASDLIHEAIMVMRAGLTVAQAAHTMHAHPSLAEAFMECMQRFLGEAVHVPPKRR